MSDNVELVYFYPRENAKQHKTDKFEIVYDEDPIPVLRRGQKFTVAIRFKNPYDSDRDQVRLFFNFGKST